MKIINLDEVGGHMHKGRLLHALVGSIDRAMMLLNRQCCL